MKTSKDEIVRFLKLLKFKLFDEFILKTIYLPLLFNPKKM